MPPAPIRSTISYEPTRRPAGAARGRHCAIAHDGRRGGDFLGGDKPFESGAE
jgi:hypothetical protein